MARTLATLTLMVAVGFMSTTAKAHCEVPCGIYDDEARFALLLEHIGTMEKAMRQITTLSKESTKNYNQIARWVATKESHANEFQHIVAQYFLTQRVKAVDGTNKKALSRYQKLLEGAHSLLVYAMKAKQTTDLAYIEKLKSSLASFKETYLQHDH